MSREPSCLQLSFFRLAGFGAQLLTWPTFLTKFWGPLGKHAIFYIKKKNHHWRELHFTYQGALNITNSKTSSGHEVLLTSVYLASAMMIMWRSLLSSPQCPASLGTLPPPHPSPIQLRSENLHFYLPLKFVWWKGSEAQMTAQLFETCWVREWCYKVKIKRSPHQGFLAEEEKLPW